MAELLKVQHTTAALNIYAVLRNSAGEVWNGSTFVTYATANLGDYDLAMTEQGTASRFYAVAMPAVAQGTYSVVAFVRAGGSPAETDTPIAVGQVEWSGTAFVPTGAILEDTAVIGAGGAGLTALGTAAELAKVPKSDSNVTWNATAAAQIQTEATDALNAYDPPTNTEMEARTIAAASYATASGVSAVETDTQDLQSRIPAALIGGRIDATVDATGMESGAIDAILDDTIGDGTLTLRQALRVLIAGMAGKLSGAATTTVTIRNTADSANVIVATVDADGNRSAVTVTP